MDEFYRDIFSKPDRPEHPGQEWIINTLIGRLKTSRKFPVIKVADKAATTGM